MPTVYNWQLGRKMHYPYEERHPRWQFAAVFNTNRCIGCQTCTMACKSTWTFSKGQEYMWWNNVESKPYGGYPQFWDMKLLQLLDEAHQREGREAAWDPSQKDGAQRPYGVFEGMTIFEEAAPPYEGDRMGFSKEGVSLPEHKTWFFHLQRICNHCTYPGCLAACPRKAIYKRQEDGVVLIDQSRCRGYKKCVEGCPYKKAMYRGTTRVSEKCVACYPRIEGKDPHITPDGVPIETRCMAACVGKIRLQGLARIDQTTGDWAGDRANPLYFLVKVEKVALPLYPQFGTEPNIYYMPPRWVPRAYLRQMFGPGADDAVNKYMAPSRELLAVLQLFRSAQKIIFRYEIIEGKKVFETEINGKPWSMYNDTVVGFDKNGTEVARLTVEEPVYTRPAKHPNSI